jgi:hypothetical protein
MQKSKIQPFGPSGLRPEILNKTDRSEMTEHDLKKQSQFHWAQMDAKSFTGEDYENKPRPGLRKNKANSKPNSQSHIPAQGSGKKKLQV